MQYAVGAHSMNGDRSGAVHNVTGGDAGNNRDDSPHTEDGADSDVGFRVAVLGNGPGRVLGNSPGRVLGPE